MPMIADDIAALIRRIFRQISVFAACIRLDGNQMHVARKRLRRIDRQPVARQRRPIDERPVWQIDARGLHLLIDLHDGMIAFRRETNFIARRIRAAVKQRGFAFALRFGALFAAAPNFNAVHRVSLSGHPQPRAGGEQIHETDIVVEQHE